jgi:hypothetical protein
MWRETTLDQGKHRIMPAFQMLAVCDTKYACLATKHAHNWATCCSLSTIA